MTAKLAPAEQTGPVVETEVKPGGPKRKGPRPKHVPQRMCIACRSHDAKRGLTRIVRTPEGAVEVDPSGKRNGRGAYLCSQAACWERALGSGMLARALKTDIGQDTAATLRQHTTARVTGTAPGAVGQEGSSA